MVGATPEPALATVLDGYVRVSRKGSREGERFISPDEQRRAIEGWAAANGATIAQWHTDMSKSGGTMARKGLIAALARVERRQTGGIVVARLDRFARNVAGGLAAIERVHALGGRVVAVHDAIDPATASGKMMLTILLAVAAWQRETAEENFEATIANATARGLFATKTPYGYMKGKDARIVPHPEHSLVVKRIFDLRTRGVGWRRICAILVAEGVPTPVGKVQWAPSSLAGIVASVAPLGVWVGPFETVVEDAWPAIVDRDLWERANAVRGVRDGDRKYDDRLYAGIARCSRCRQTMARETNNSGFLSYKCKTPGCKATTIGVDILDAYVSDLVDARLARWRLTSERDDDGTIEELAKARDRANKEFEAWRDDTEMRELLGAGDYRAGMKVRAAKRDEAEQALAVARAERNGGLDLPPDVTVKLADLPWEDRRRVVEAAMHAVWVKRSPVRGPGARQRVGERLRVEYIDSRVRHDLPRPSDRVALSAVD